MSVCVCVCVCVCCVCAVSMLLKANTYTCVGFDFRMRSFNKDGCVCLSVCVYKSSEAASFALLLSCAAAVDHNTPKRNRTEHNPTEQITTQHNIA